MNMELFSSKQEGIDFLNYKAQKRIEELEKLCQENKEEITININNCEEIFERYNKENIINSIIELDNTVNSVEITPEELTEINQKREKLLEQLKKFLEELLNKYDSESLDLNKKMKYLDDKEDIEFAYKRIVNRSMELQNKLGTIEAIENEYSEARNFDVEKYKKESSLFNMVRDYLSLTNEKIEKEEPSTNYSEELYVIKIEQAPDNLVIEENSTSEENQPEVTDVESDASFFGIDDTLTEQIISNDTISFNEVEEEPTKLEDVITEEIISPETDLTDDTHSINNEKNKQFIEENLENKFEKENQPLKVEIEEVKEDTQGESQEKILENSDNSTKQAEKSNESNNLTYTMDKNDTINNLAFALFQDEKITDLAAEMIFDENKDIITKYLTEKNIELNDNIYKEPGILNGVTLNLTNIYEKVIENSKSNK